MQAMDRNAGLESDVSGQFTKWVIAAALAAVALMGTFTLVAAMIFFFDLPGWVQVTGGVVLAIGTVAFAWLVASALEASRRSQTDTRRSSRPTDIRSRR